MISNRDVVRIVRILNTEKVPGHVFSKGLDLMVFSENWTDFKPFGTDFQSNWCSAPKPESKNKCV